MTKFSLDAMPEVFVSNAKISKAVSAAVARGKLRKIGSRLYTSNFEEALEHLVKRHWYHLITDYFPDALITDRTALENQPAADGSVCLISEKTRAIELPGLIFRPRTGPRPLENDRPFVGGAYLASTARAYLENMRPSRQRAGHVPRTLSREMIEARLERLLRLNGEEALNRLRDQAQEIAPALDLETECEQLSALIGALLGTQAAQLTSSTGQARAAGTPFDPDRIQLFEALFVALRETPTAPRFIPKRSSEANANLAFFDAYFSNFIEGTEFEVDEAHDIVFKGVIPTDRPQDAHDVLGTYRIVSEPSEMTTRPHSFDDFLTLLRGRHAVVMQAHSDKNPGEFKSKVNRAGHTIFVEPDLVMGTLKMGFEFFHGLDKPLQRAIFMMALVSEVHPFVDGNGRVGRIMMNAELIAADQERIIIPTGYRSDYLLALKALSRNHDTDPVIRMLDYAHRYTHTINWDNLHQARHQLDETSAFAKSEDTRLRMPASDHRLDGTDFKK